MILTSMVTIDHTSEENPIESVEVGNYLAWTLIT
jgi:hypothetical protein